MTMFIVPGLKPGGAVVSCSKLRYSSVPVFLSTPPCFTSFSTPTIVNHGMFAVGGPDGRTRRPIGL